MSFLVNPFVFATAGGGGLDETDGVLVTRSNTTYPASTATPINWAAESYDRTDWFDAGSNTRLTVPAGVSLVRPLAALSGGGSGGPFRITKNGGDFYGQGKSYTGISTAVSMASAIVAVSAGDYFELFRDSGGTTAPTSADGNWFGVEILDSATQYALVRKSSTQSIDPTTNLTFDTEVADVGGWFNSASSTTNFVVPAGVTRVRVSGQAEAGSNAEQLAVIIQKNGASVRGHGSQSEFYSGAKWVSAVSAVLDVTAGDIFTLRVGNATGTAQATERTWFCIEEVPDYARAIVYHTANLVLSSGVTAVVPWNSELIDTDAAHDNSTNPERVTVPSGMTQARVTFNVDGVNNENLTATVSHSSGGTRGAGLPQEDMNLGGSTLLNSFGTWRDVSPGDYFRLHLTTSSGGFTLVDSVSTWMCVEFR